jgi:hypothetical protein
MGLISVELIDKWGGFGIMHSNKTNGFNSSDAYQAFKSILHLFATASAGLAIALLIQDDAHGYCYKPTPPNKPFRFVSNDQIDRYNKSVETYNRDLNVYKQCFARSYDSYKQRFNEYLRCEAKSFGKAYSGCSRPRPPL